MINRRHLIEESKKHLRDSETHGHEYKKDIRKLITALEFTMEEVDNAYNEGVEKGYKKGYDEGAEDQRNEWSQYIG